jgi:hypothetical protein
MEVAPSMEEEDCKLAQVVPLLKVRHLGDRRFDYLVPASLADRVRVGSVVGVPFGRRSARAVRRGWLKAISHPTNRACGW